LPPAGLLALWAVVEYDGTDFFGFQVQARERTVQGEIERALEAITGTETRIIGAGRTDRGVHARGQVIRFEAAWKHSLPELQRALNAVLTGDMAVLEMGQAAGRFHPRFSAQSRVYRYTILNRPWPSPLHRLQAWHVRQDLDLDCMARASQCLIGTRDFGTFGRPPEPDRSQATVRTVIRAEWLARDPVLTFDIEANAFLYRMVRSIVGTLVLVGSGALSVNEFQVMLEARDRCLVKQVAPAHGLCLMQVNYAGREGVLQ
jgi:tRNA pseudouridine38-40 synthase